MKKANYYIIGLFVGGIISNINHLIPLKFWLVFLVINITFGLLIFAIILWIDTLGETRQKLRLKR